MKREERLEPVRDFSSLRAGMLVVLKPCGACRGKHYNFLLHKEFHDGVWGWCGDTSPVCEYSSRSGRMFSERAVAARMVYRIVDEQLDSETLTTRKAEPVT